MFTKLFTKNGFAKGRIIEEHIYELVAEELQRGEKRIGLWTKAVALSDGNQAKAESLYIQLRAQSLVDEQRVINEINEKAQDTHDELKNHERQKANLNAKPKSCEAHNSQPRNERSYTQDTNGLEENCVICNKPTNTVIAGSRVCITCSPEVTAVDASKNTLKRQFEVFQNDEGTMVAVDHSDVFSSDKVGDLLRNGYKAKAMIFAKSEAEALKNAGIKTAKECDSSKETTDTYRAAQKQPEVIAEPEYRDTKISQRAWFRLIVLIGIGIISSVLVSIAAEITYATPSKGSLGLGAVLLLVIMLWQFNYMKKAKAKTATGHVLFQGWKWLVLVYGILNILLLLGAIGNLEDPNASIAQASTQKVNTKKVHASSEKLLTLPIKWEGSGKWRNNLQQNWGNNGFTFTKDFFYLNIDSSKLTNEQKSRLYDRKLHCALSLVDSRGSSMEVSSLVERSHINKSRFLVIPLDKYFDGFNKAMHYREWNISCVDKQYQYSSRIRYNQ